MTSWIGRDGRLFWVGWLLALAVFVAAAVAAHWQYTFPLDERVARYLAYNHHGPWMSNAFWELWRELGRRTIVVAVILVLAAVLVLRWQIFAAALTLGALPMLPVYLAIRYTIDRPLDESQRTDPARTYPIDASFPSGHAFGAALAFGLILAFAPLIVPWRPVQWAVRALCAVIIFFAGFERLVNGNHWMSDVLGAYLLAALFVLAAWRLSVIARPHAAGARALEPNAAATV